MKHGRSGYIRHRFPPEIISHAVWRYYRFSVSFREVEDLLAERGVNVTYETIRQWTIKFGTRYARRLKRRQGRVGGIWYLDEVFITISGERQYLWRAVDQDGDVIDILVQPRRDGRAAKRFFRKLLKNQRQAPHRIVTDKLGIYRVAHRVDGDENFVQRPGIWELGLSPLQALGIIEPELRALPADCLVWYGDSSLGGQILDISKADTESLVEPNDMTYDFG